MTDPRPRAWNSTLPVRSSGLSRTPFPQPSGQALRSRVWLRSAPKAGEVIPLQRKRRTDPITAAVRRLVHARDRHLCLRCGGSFPDGIEMHHRRIKGMGGSTAEHAHCCCAIVTLCSRCHSFVHLNRRDAEADGLIIPRASEHPFLYPVLVHERGDAGGQMAWPTCDGRWTTDEPEGALSTVPPQGVA